MSSLRRGLGVALVASGVLLFNCLARTTVPTTVPSAQAILDHLSGSALTGFQFTPEQAHKLESRIRKNPQDVSSRAELLGYYFSHHSAPGGANAARVEQVLWMIDHAPASEFSGTPFCQIDRLLDAKGYAKARDAWLKQVTEHPDSGAVLANAAKFVMLCSLEEAEGLLGRAMKAEPTNPQWPRELASLEMQGVSQLKPGERRARASRALSELEKALRLTRGRQQQSFLVTDAAKAAFDAGDMARAKQYAQRLLDEAARFPGGWNTRDAIYTGNTILGRVALANGNVAAAREYLLASAATPGSPSLESFGPNTSLANELLARGARQAVLKYFQLCGRWWEMGDQKLKEWTRTVRAGGTPRWGANLDY